MNKSAILVLIILFPLLSRAQFPLKQAAPLPDNDRVRWIEMRKATRIGSDEPITAVVVRSQIALEQVQITIGDREINVPLDTDAPTYTYFVSLDTLVFTFGLQVVPDQVPVKVYTIHSGPSPTISSAGRIEEPEDCDLSFNAISQSQWRAGLDPPSYSRSFTEVEHVVVHHAAGSNTNTDYVQVVRDIYLYHTEVNGWSDIGYNYLVAQDGSIFAGRDPANGAQDNVLGAHFCGANSSTMGICMLGNYETAQPTTASIGSLDKIVSFKLNKESLFPDDTHNHSLGTFKAVIGHRDGCATACPGENLYSQLGSIRQRVTEVLETCNEDTSSMPLTRLDFSVSDPLINQGQSVIYTNESHGYENYLWQFDLGTPGQSEQNSVVEVIYEIPGVMDVRLIGFVNGTSDTLVRKNLIEVAADDPLIFPNPMVSSEAFSIQYHFPVENVTLLSITGNVVGSIPSEGNVYRLPKLTAGLYLLQILTQGKSYHQKIIVRQ